MPISHVDDMTEGLSAVRDAIEAFCDGDESLCLAHLNRLGSAAAGYAVAAMLTAWHGALTVLEGDDSSAAYRARAQLRAGLDLLDGEIAVNAAALVIHEALSDV